MSRLYDLETDYEAGRPIRVDITAINKASPRKAIERFLNKRGHYVLNFSTEMDKRPPYRFWLVCDWQSGKSKEDLQKEHPYYDFFSKGHLAVEVRSCDREENLRSTVKYWLNKVNSGRIYYVLSKTENIHGRTVLHFYNTQFIPNTEETQQ